MGVIFLAGIESLSFVKVFVSGSRRTPNKGRTSIGYNSAFQVVLREFIFFTIFLWCCK